MGENTVGNSTVPGGSSTYDNSTVNSVAGYNSTYTYEDTYANATSHSDTGQNDTYTYDTTHTYYNDTAYSSTGYTITSNYDDSTLASFSDTRHNNTYDTTHAYYDGTEEGNTHGDYGSYFPGDYHLNGLPSDDNDDQSLHYSSYFFEKITYLYIWEILVIITCLLNIVVISVLLRQKMRSPTYMILVAVSISDSLTGLVTLPTYIAVFKASVEIAKSSFDYNDHNEALPANLSQEDLEYINSLEKGSVDREQLPTYSSSLSTELCTGFMISKFFLSKSFHTVSVWLTVFLATQRAISVLSPFKSISCALNIKRTSIVCIVIFSLAPFLHIYHLLDDKSIPGYCEWSMGTGKDCGSTCAYFWIVLMLGHLLPCIFLLIFTVMFAYNLGKNTSSLQRALTGSGSRSPNQATSTARVSKSIAKIWRQVSTIGSKSERRRSSSTAVFNNRQRENRRASVVVIAIVVMFLIPEVPYSGYLVYNAISAHMSHKVGLRTNRSLMAAYDILLVLSFNANFYIYTFVNRRFRQVLRETIIAPLCRACSALGIRSNILFHGKFWRRSSYSTSATTGPTTQTDSSSSKGEIEMVGLNRKKKQSLQESSVQDQSFGRNAKQEEKESDSGACETILQHSANSKKELELCDVDPTSDYSSGPGVPL